MKISAACAHDLPVAAAWWSLQLVALVAPTSVSGSCDDVMLAPAADGPSSHDTTFSPVQPITQHKYSDEFELLKHA